MTKTNKTKISLLLTFVTVLALCLGVLTAKPTQTAKAESLATTNWTISIENNSEFRVQNGNTYWSTYTNSVTTASMLDYTEINGKTLSAINAENPGAITVTLQPAGGSIGSFYRVSINTGVAGFTTADMATVVIRNGWSHTDANATYTIDTDLYFAHEQNSWATDSANWKCVLSSNVVDITNQIQMQDQGTPDDVNTRSILISTSGNSYWTNSVIPNEGGGTFLNLLYLNGVSVKEWNNQAHAKLQSGEITDITYGSNIGIIKNNQGNYAPILTLNSSPSGSLGSFAQVFIPVAYISHVSSFKIAKGFANLQGDTLYYVSQDVEYVKSGSSFVKVASTVDISKAFKIIAQDYTSSNGTMLYYLHTNNVKYWTEQYDSTDAYSINEREWKGVGDSSLQGGAVQMSYIEFNGRTLYDINAGDNGAYGATQGNIASGGKYAPILAFLTPLEMGDSIKLQVPSAYPSGSGTAVSNHKTITIKKGFFVLDSATNIKYEVTKDIQWDFEDGAWQEHVNQIETTVTDAKIFGSANDAFAGVALEDSDYSGAPNTYAGTVKTALSFARSANFLSHVLIDDVALSSPGEAFLNVWSNFGYFTFRPGNNSATKITILAGCKFPTYNALLTGANEVYVTTEDATFVKDGSGNWVLDDGLEEGEYETSISKLVYSRDNASTWMMFTLSTSDYPSATAEYNLKDTANRVPSLNLYDKIVVDGYTITSRMAQNTVTDVEPTVNLWQANCFAIKIPGAEALLTGAQKVTIRAGAQFPSYEYFTEGVEAYFVTTEEITFVNVGDANGVWERQYKATFVADGEVVDTISYLASQGLTAPEVPEKDGYRGSWESYTANGNITVNAVYTANPTSLGSTSISEMRRIDNTSNLLVIQPSNSDYPASVEGSWNIGLDVSHLSKFNLFDYITINGQTLREIGVSSTAINKFTRAGLGLETTLSDQMTIVVKKGCEIPSYAFWQNPTTVYSCYLIDADYTCKFDKSEGKTEDIAFTITKTSTDTVDNNYNEFEDHYILSDLNAPGYYKTDCFKDRIEELTKCTDIEHYRYGHVDSTSFTVSFDFKFTGATYYENLEINFGTQGFSEGTGNIETHFGWRIYLIRGNGGAVTQDFCVEYYSNTSTFTDNIRTLGNAALVEGQVYNITIGYRLDDAATGTVTVYTALNGTGCRDTYVLGGTFVTYAPYIDTFIFKSQSSGNITIGDPGKDLSAPVTNGVIFEGTNIDTVYTDKIVLPSPDPVANGKFGEVFVGWTTDNTTYPDLYPAGYEFTVGAEIKLYPVWMNFNMVAGASVRMHATERGIRFTVKIDKGLYDAGAQLNYFTALGTIVAPTSYLAKKELTHADLPVGYYVEIPTAIIFDNGVYNSAMINISPDQYAREFSARGFVKVAYTTGDGYIYTAYNKDQNSRSIFQVADRAKSNQISDGTGTLNEYVGSVADLTITSSYGVTKTNDNGGYTVNAQVSGDTVTVTLDKAVKAVMINGVRLVMGYGADVKLSGIAYSVSGYKLSADGKIATFTFAKKDDQVSKEQYIEELEKYLARTDYTAEHFAVVKGLAQGAIDAINASDEASEWQTTFDNAVNAIATIKTAAELKANNTGSVEETLAAPVLSRGLGYTVTWGEVANADYYTVQDDNDYRDRVVIMANEALTYKAEVIGNHTITVTAHSYYKARNSATSNAVTTPEVKPVFTYKSMLDGLYKFSSSQMSTMGLSTSGGYYYDSEDKKYFAYYNKDTGWTPYETAATDWTSPSEFPAHAQRLKDMGNNVILVARDTKAEYKSTDVWSTSRLKYVMDTAWSMGMKVLVCDAELYALSMSDNSGTGATSKAQVTTAINNNTGFKYYVTHPAFYGFSLDDEPYGKWISALSYTISAIDEACEALGVSDPFYLACLFQAQGGELGKEIYLTQSSLESYYNKWLAIDGVDSKYLYVDIYTQHAMDQPTNRYNESFEVVYSDSYLGGKYKFHQAITAHTQNNGTLLEQDLYMSLLYAAAHNVAGYSWFCYFPITGELAGSMVGYDGNGDGNGIGNNASGSYYNAAKTAGYQFELIQGLLDGYTWQTRTHNDRENLLTTTLSNGSNTITCYVNADVDGMSGSVTVTASGSQCYLVGYGVGTAEAPYQAVSGSVTLAPGQAVICMQ